MSRKSSQKLFHLNENEIQPVLFCDISDSEDVLMLDDEDLEFLENDVEYQTKHQNCDSVPDVKEIIIDPPLQPTKRVAGCSKNEQVIDSTPDDIVNCQNLMPKNDFVFTWKKTKPRSVAEAAPTKDDFEYGKVLLPLDYETIPFEIFEKGKI